MTYADKSLLLGDETADALIRYAAALTRNGTADSVEVNAVSSDGDDVVATFLLGPGAPLMAETARSSLPEPENAEATQRMVDRIAELDHAPAGRPLDLDDTNDYVETFDEDQEPAPSSRS